MNSIPARQMSPLPHRLRREAREKYNTLPKNYQEMYRREVCDMCGAHLTVRQLNRIILEGVPPPGIRTKTYFRISTSNKRCNFSRVVVI